MHPALHVNSKASVYGLDATKVVIIFEKTKFYAKKCSSYQKSKRIIDLRSFSPTYTYTRVEAFIHKGLRHGICFETYTYHIPNMYLNIYLILYMLIRRKSPKRVFFMCFNIYFL